MGTAVERSSASDGLKAGAVASAKVVEECRPAPEVVVDEGCACLPAPTSPSKKSTGSPAIARFDSASGSLQTGESGDIEIAESQGKASRNFIRQMTDEESKEDTAVAFSSPSLRRMARRIFRSPYCDFVSGMVILVDFMAMCRDTDMQAKGTGPDSIAKPIMMCCFVFYCLEISLRVYVYGYTVMNNKQNVMDAFVIGMSLFEYIMEFIAHVHALPSLLLLRMLRLCRLLRLLRAVKLFSGMKELRRLLQMITTCAKTMFWSFLMTFLLMSVWSVLAVELVHPVVSRLAERNVWPGCERCQRAFESVTAANLTFFQTVLAGDSWGLVAVPVLEESPPTAFVFCGAVLTMVYGVMQLITAVVVDSFADLRRLDVNALVHDIDAEEKQEKEILAKIFVKIDADGSGAISYTELADGARRVDEFRNWLRVMDIDASDLERLFSIIDEDCSGEVDLEEFIDALYRMKNAESRTATKFVKHMVETMDRKADDLAQKVGILSQLLEKLESLEMQMERMRIMQQSSNQDELIVQQLETAFQRASDLCLDTVMKTTMEQILPLVRKDSEEVMGSGSLLIVSKSQEGLLQAARTEERVDFNVDSAACSTQSSEEEDSEARSAQQAAEEPRIPSWASTRHQTPPGLQIPAPHIEPAQLLGDVPFAHHATVTPQLQANDLDDDADEELGALTVELLQPEQIAIGIDCTSSLELDPHAQLGSEYRDHSSSTASLLPLPWVSFLQFGSASRRAS
eukprot:TRINITY_DN18411_c0_g4_i1.p1 TRINITY_DN18411_c0_g4~~TRINITY_DN18411_c0_g4_i1.p1  ORF type:complete len:741 (+),score=188.75 TRINITY_DN18411_c0_g4_i1:158-2380(+)